MSYANIKFDLGQLKKDPNRIQNARDLYIKALDKNPKDSNVMADLGYSYLESEVPDPQKAIEHLEAANEIDPRNERILTSLSFAYLKLKNPAKSSEYLAKLKNINPENGDIAKIEQEMKAEAAQ